MSHFTTVLGMQLANPGTGEPFSTAVVNGDFILLENGIIADRSRLTSLEGGVGRNGASGTTLWIITDLAALAAKSGRAGDVAIVTALGNAEFVCTGTTNWVQVTTASFASAATRDTEYAKAAGAYLLPGVRATTADVPGVVLEYAGVYATPANINGRDTAAGWFIVQSNIRRHYEFAVSVATAVGSQIPNSPVVIHRRTYAQRVIVNVGGSISGTATGGAVVTATAGGTITSNMPVIVVGGSGVAYVGRTIVDIAAGTGADVTIGLNAAGGGPVTIGGLLTYDVEIAGEYS